MTRVIYSSHSSFSELRRFVETVRPGAVFRTEESGGYDCDGRTREPAVWFGKVVRGGKKRGEMGDRSVGKGAKLRGGTVRCEAGVIFGRVMRERRADGVSFARMGRGARRGRRVGNCARWLG